VSGTFYTKAMWLRTKTEIFETRMGKADPFGRYWGESPYSGCQLTGSTLRTGAQRFQHLRKLRGPYARWRNIQALRRLNFDRKYYGIR
jgi:hypothetical protein